MLDCYRVTIMYRPPSFPWRHTDSFAQHASSKDRMKALLRFPEALTNPYEMPTPCTTYNQRPLITLASLATYLWPATSLSESTRYPDDPDPEKAHDSALWKSDFVEMACQSWLRSQRTTQCSTLVLYHHINTILHANLVLLQRFAHSSQTATTRDPEKSPTVKAIHCWIQGRDYEVARWHSTQLVSTIESAIAASKSNPTSQDSRLPSSFLASPPLEGPRSSFEAPHTPYAIYYATLVLWAGELTSDMTTTSAASAKSHLVRGEMILSAHKARIAQLLARVLSEIK